MTTPSSGCELASLPAHCRWWIVCWSSLWWWSSCIRWLGGSRYVVHVFFALWLRWYRYIYIYYIIIIYIYIQGFSCVVPVFVWGFLSAWIFFCWDYYTGIIIYYRKKWWTYVYRYTHIDRTKWWPKNKKGGDPNDWRSIEASYEHFASIQYYD